MTLSRSERRFWLRFKNSPVGLFFVAIEEGLAVLGFGVFWNELVDDQIAAVGALEVKFGFGSIGVVGLCDSARDAEKLYLGLREAGIGANFV